MEREMFVARLAEATKRVCERTGWLVEEMLPDEPIYLMRPNCSYDGNAVMGDEEVYPEETLPIGQVNLPPTDAAGVVKRLWRREKVPEWVNVQIVKADADYTYIFLECCGRFKTGVGQYHMGEGVWPFHVQGPLLPREWTKDRNIMQRERMRHVMKTGQWYELPALDGLLEKYGKIRLGERYLETWLAADERRHNERAGGSK